MKKQSKLIQGNAAIAQGAFYAGARYYAGYPITPSSEIAEIASRELPKLGGIFMCLKLCGTLLKWALWSRCCLASGKISQPNSKP